MYVPIASVLHLLDLLGAYISAPWLEKQWDRFCFRDISTGEDEQMNHSIKMTLLAKMARNDSVDSIQSNASNSPNKSCEF